MDLQTTEYDKSKLNTFWREILLSDDAPVTPPSPTQKELGRRADETGLSQRAADGRGLEEWLLAARDGSERGSTSQ